MEIDITTLRPDTLARIIRDIQEDSRDTSELQKRLEEWDDPQGYMLDAEKALLSH